MQGNQNNNSDRSANGYLLTRAWFNFAFESPDWVTPSHTAMFLWFVQLNNRMGWAERFGAPTDVSMCATGIKSYNTYKKVFNDLVYWGWVVLVKESKNQWTSCVIALSNFDKAPTKALDNALMMHANKHIETTDQITSESSDSINKQLNKETIKPINQQTDDPDTAAADPEPATEKKINFEFEEVWNLYDKKVGEKKKLKRKWEKLKPPDREAIMAYIPEYKKSEPRKQYRKNFETFLNNESWKDEIIKPDNNETANRPGKSNSAGNASDGREDFGEL